MSFCGNCGARITAEAIFCSHCGNSLLLETPEVPEPRRHAQRAAYLAGRILGGIALFFITLLFFGLILLGMESLAKAIAEAADRRSNR